MKLIEAELALYLEEMERMKPQKTPGLSQVHYQLKELLKAFQSIPKGSPCSQTHLNRISDAFNQILQATPVIVSFGSSNLVERHISSVFAVFSQQVLPQRQLDILGSLGSIDTKSMRNSSPICKLIQMIQISIVQMDSDQETIKKGLEWLLKISFSLVSEDINACFLGALTQILHWVSDEELKAPENFKEIVKLLLRTLMDSAIFSAKNPLQKTLIPESFGIFSFSLLLTLVIALENLTICTQRFQNYFKETSFWDSLKTKELEDAIRASLSPSSLEKFPLPTSCKWMKLQLELEMRLGFTGPYDDVFIEYLKKDQKPHFKRLALFYTGNLMCFEHFFTGIEQERVNPHSLSDLVPARSKRYLWDFSAFVRKQTHKWGLRPIQRSQMKPISQFPLSSKYFSHLAIDFFDFWCSSSLYGFCLPKSIQSPKPIQRWFNGFGRRFTRVFTIS